MSSPQVLICILLAGVLGLFAWGRWRYDVVAFFALMVAVLLRLVPFEQAFAGFGHPATVTVAMVLILSRVLSATGATDVLIRYVMAATHDHVAPHRGPRRIAALMSAVMNNVGALALLMPIAMASAALAASRQGKPYRGRLRNFRIRAGDVLLLQGETDRLAGVFATLGWLPLAGRGMQIGQRGRGGLAIALFAAAIAAATFGLLPLQIAFGLAGVGVVVANLITPREVYEAIDWPVIVLLGAMIPIGGALESTGAAKLIAGGIVALAGGVPPVVVLVVLLIVTMTLSDILNNAATVVVMAPIAATVARDLGVNADPFLMAVAVGGSCAFLTPIGHQNNTLVMGPGGYAFGDYWRMGLPLEVLILLAATPMIVLVWPLH